MSDFHSTWKLTRGRFEETVLGLNQAQLNFRPYAGCLTIGEMILHVTGIEISFSCQLQGEEPAAEHVRIQNSGTQGIMDDQAFPYTAEEITPELIGEALSIARAYVEPVLENPTEDMRNRQVKSALGPMIDGIGTLSRLAQHPAYHQGQAYLIRHMPDFPA